MTNKLDDNQKIGKVTITVNYKKETTVYEIEPSQYDYVIKELKNAGIEFTVEKIPMENQSMTINNECICGRTFDTRKELGEHLIWWYLNQ